jgi:hypothetical protein
MKSICTDLWQLEGPPVRMAGGVYLPLASTVVRLPDRSLLVYSPIAIDDDQASEIAALGEVAHVVAPSLLHHLHVRAAAERWPRATLHGAPGLATKRSDLRFHRELGGPLDPALRDAIDVEVIAGAPRLNESVLFHRASGAMLCADLVFNIPRPANLRTRLALALMGVGGRRPSQSRMWKLLARDRSVLRTSLDRVLRWPIAMVVPAHGEPVALGSAELAPLLTRSYGGRVALALAA